MGTAVDVSTGAAVAANNEDAVGAVVPPSPTNHEDAYVGVPVAFEGVCVGAFADGAGESIAECPSKGAPDRGGHPRVCPKVSVRIEWSPSRAECLHKEPPPSAITQWGPSL